MLFYASPTFSAGYLTLDVSGSVSSLIWTDIATTPTIKQSDQTANGVNGNNFFVQAQSSTGTTTTGGNLVIRPGKGTTDQGYVAFGNTDGDAVRFTPRPSGSTTWMVQSAVTAFAMSQNSTSIANGSTWSWSAQSTTLEGGIGGSSNINAGSGLGATTGTGGSVNLNAALGTTVGGTINFWRGGTNAATFTPNPTGTSGFTFVAGVTAVSFTQAVSSAANGAAWTFTSQGSSVATGTVTGGGYNVNGGACTGAATTCTGGAVTITGGACSGAATTNNGGDVVLSGGNATNGTTNNFGKCKIQSAGTTLFTFGDSGTLRASTSIAVDAGGTFTLTAAQYRFGLIRLTGTLAANVIVVFPSSAGAEWILDASAVTLNGFTITARANSTNWGTTIATTAVYKLHYGGSAGRLYGNTMTT